MRLDCGSARSRWKGTVESLRVVVPTLRVRNYLRSRGPSPAIVAKLGQSTLGGKFDCVTMRRDNESRSGDFWLKSTRTGRGRAFGAILVGDPLSKHVLRHLWNRNFRARLGRLTKSPSAWRILHGRDFRLGNFSELLHQPLLRPECADNQPLDVR